MARRESATNSAAAGKRDHPGLQAEAQASGPSLTLAVMFDGEPFEIEISSFADVPANIARRLDAGMPAEAARAAAHEDLVAGMVRLQEIAMTYGPPIRRAADLSPDPLDGQKRWKWTESKR